MAIVMALHKGLRGITTQTSLTKLLKKTWYARAYDAAAFAGGPDIAMG